MSVPRGLAGLAFLAALAGCRARPAPSVIRLADIYRPEAVVGRVPDFPPRPRTEWRFDAAPGPAAAATIPAPRWDAPAGVSGLAVRDGRLTGRSTTDFPVLHFERDSVAGDRELLHEVQVRARVSKGANIAVAWRESEKLDMKEVLERADVFGWRTRTALVAGPEMRTYTLRSPFPVAGAEIRHLLLRPSDAGDATFEIESVRLVFRREHLATVPSGLGWQGLSEVYRETLVSRAPEALRLRVRVPARPRLDLAVGTPDDRPVTFRIAVMDDPARAERTLVERTVTRPHRWEDVTVDLGAEAGKEVTLALSLRAETPGTIGFWGAPILRTREAVPAVVVAGAPEPRPQGVIVVWADTLRRDHLSLYGYTRPTSPVIDRLAGEGILFRDCIGHASWTKVATPSLMTSLYPTSHGVQDFPDRLPASATTLAEVYRAAGYATLSFSSILFTGRFSNLHQGFDVVHEDSSLPDRSSSKTSREYVDRLLGWLQTHADVPFFAFLHVSDPHDPYRPHAPYDAMWGDLAKAGEHERQGKDVKKFVADPLMKLFGMPNRAELVRAGIDADAYATFDRNWYDGSVREMDTEIGRLVEGLGNLGLRGKVVVAFTGDHGEEFLEHGRMFHGQTVYGEMNNVPLVLWRPGALPAGRVVEETVQVVDIMPTLLEMSGLRTPAEAQGTSLAPFWTARGETGAVRAAPVPEGRTAISEKAATTDLGGPPPRDTESVAVVAGGWKLIHNLRRPPGAPEFELFDHRRDPLDAQDVAAAHPDVVARLVREETAWRARATSARLRPDGETQRALSPEELERLRALGYVQ
jgi:arylsulfatase A-like enzyme